jgi:hypothetical protein
LEEEVELAVAKEKETTKQKEATDEQQAETIKWK